MKRSRITLLILLLLGLGATCSRAPIVPKNDKIWLHRANWIEKAQQFQYDYAGLEIDVVFDDTTGTFFVKHDTTDHSFLLLDDWCASLDNIGAIGVWFDVKNLNHHNSEEALRCLSALREKYQMQGKLVVESAAYNELKAFDTSGFVASFYIPYFNPDSVDSLQYKHITKTIRNAIDSGITHISGYDFQYEYLKREFPNQPKLLWTIYTDKDYQAKWIKRMSKDPTVEILLLPNENY